MGCAMIPSSEIFAVLAAACLIPSLYRGAVQDLKEFKFAEIHFDTLWINAAIVLLVLMYVTLLIEGLWFVAVEFLVLSIVASLIFSFIGLRFGGGGDWRALCYIAVFAPFILINVVVVSALCGFVQAVYWLMRPDIDAPPLFRKIPFALSILCGYLITLVWATVTIISG